MKIYIAAPWASRETVPEVAAKLEAKGHTITQKWWAVEDVPENQGPERDALLQEQAFEDTTGVRTADLVLVLNTSKSEGKAVEQGVAIAYNLPIIAVGTRGAVSANVFHYLPNYLWVEDVDRALDALNVVQWLVGFLQMNQAKRDDANQAQG